MMRMRVIGLTGGAGMGKSALGAWLEKRGERVIDTDVLAREAAAPGSASLAEICREFGEAVLRADRTLDRERLAAIVFGDASRRAALEVILHPVIRRAWRAQVEECRKEGLARVIVIIPLLFETGAESEFDRTLCVVCGENTQKKRLSRRGWTLEMIRARNAAQWPIARKMECAQRVIWSETPVPICGEQALRAMN